MRKATLRIAGLVAAASAAMALAGAGVASASPSHSAPKHVTGIEKINGSAYGKAAVANNPRIPLTLSGLVRATDRNFVLGGNGNTHTLWTSKGALTVTTIGKQSTKATLNKKSCWSTETIRQSFVFVPKKSNGSFTGASGRGAYQVYFAAYLPRYTHGPHKGACNTSNNAQPLSRGAVVNFQAAGILTVVR